MTNDERVVGPANGPWALGHWSLLFDSDFWFRASGFRLGFLFPEPRQLQRPPRLRVAHETFPHPAGPGVFGHDQGDAQVDADDVGGGPAGVGIEGVDEAVALPRHVAV